MPHGAHQQILAVFGWLIDVDRAQRVSRSSAVVADAGARVSRHDEDEDDGEQQKWLRKSSADDAVPRGNPDNLSYLYIATNPYCPFCCPLSPVCVDCACCCCWWVRIADQHHAQILEAFLLTCIKACCCAWLCCCCICCRRHLGYQDPAKRHTSYDLKLTCSALICLRRSSGVDPACCCKYCAYTCGLTFVRLGIGIGVRPLVCGDCDCWCCEAAD